MKRHVYKRAMPAGRTVRSSTWGCLAEPRCLNAKMLKMRRDGISCFINNHMCTCAQSID